MSTCMARMASQQRFYGEIRVKLVSLPLIPGTFLGRESWHDRCVGGVFQANLKRSNKIQNEYRLAH